MKFNSKTIGVLLAFAALSFTSCAAKTEVRYVPATDVEVTDATEADTRPEVTEPEATNVPFTLPIVKETAPEITEPELTAPPVINPGYDTNNDWLLDDLEYATFVEVLSENGFYAADQATSQDLGATFCDLAALSASGDEFVDTATTVLDGADVDISPEEFGFILGALGTVMCQSEYVRLGLF